MKSEFNVFTITEDEIREIAMNEDNIDLSRAELEAVVEHFEELLNEESNWQSLLTNAVYTAIDCRG